MAHNTYSDSGSKTPLVLGALAVIGIIVFLVFASTNSIPVDNSGAPGTVSTEGAPEAAPAPEAAAPASGG